jgi:hypothetical protein
MQLAVEELLRTNAFWIIGIVDYFCVTFTAFAKASAVKSAFAEATVDKTGCGAVGPVPPCETRILEKSVPCNGTIFRD